MIEKRSWEVVLWEVVLPDNSAGLATILYYNHVGAPSEPDTTHSFAMPRVRFDELAVHRTYSRPELAKLWKYSGYQALARGVVTPSGHPYIILFVTAEKQEGFEPYADRLVEGRLYWEGPTDHFAEDRMLAAEYTGDEIHVFYRARHHSDFEYLGRAEVEKCRRLLDRPSSFVLRLTDI